jgi:hypothetical protein
VKLVRLRQTELEGTTAVAGSGETMAPTLFYTCSAEEEPMDSRLSTGSEAALEGRQPRWL